MITIKNLRREKPTEEWQVKVDRTSVLGNPFIMEDDTEKERQWVCNEYEKRFKTILSENNIEKIHHTFINELYRLRDLYRKHGKLELFCWCSPQRCHAETIKKWLEENG